MDYVYKRSKMNFSQFEILKWYDFLFCLHEDFVAASLWNNFVLLWHDSFVGEKYCELVIKKRYFVKIF